MESNSEARILTFQTGSKKEGISPFLIHFLMFLHAIFSGLCGKMSLTMEDTRVYTKNNIA